MTQLTIAQTAEEFLSTRKLMGPPPKNFRPYERPPVNQEPAADFMSNVPKWLRDQPQEDGTEEEISCQALVVGAGQCGTTATLRLAEAGVDVLCLEAQSWESYSVYPTDMAVYNSKIFLDRGVPPYDPVDIFNEYMNKTLGHALPQLVRDFAFRSGEMFDWLLSYIPEELTQKYAHPTNYRGNPGFRGETCGQKSFIGMVQWRDQATNQNMWGYVLRYALKAAADLGANFLFGTRALKLLQDETGRVIGCLARNKEGKQFKIRCDAVLMAAGDYGGNREMMLDLSDQLRNLAWSFGLDRTDYQSIRPAGRDGSGIKMCLWAGATMEAGPRAGQSCGVNKRPSFPFGGCWPTFGSDGKRFMNETTVRFGATGPIDMQPVGGIITVVTDSNWEQYLNCQSYGHEMMDLSNDEWVEIVREDVRNYKTGREGFPVHRFSTGGLGTDLCYAADTLEELGEILGYSGESLQNFLDEVERYNRFCAEGRDGDWGCDPGYLFPILKPPFIGVAEATKVNIPRGGLCQHAGVCTNGRYNVLNADKHPIPGLYAAGNCCGQRYAVQYHTPTAGNSCGSALTTGYVAAEHMMAFLNESHSSR